MIKKYRILVLSLALMFFVSGTANAQLAGGMQQISVPITSSGSTTFQYYVSSRDLTSK
jgi:hypothetical protein